jgi:hypothetical protein
LNKAGHFRACHLAEAGHIRSDAQGLENYRANPREGEAPPKKEYFLVAMKDQSAALETLRFRRPDLDGAMLLMAGEATPEFVDWLDVKDGQILSIMVVA